MKLILCLLLVILVASPSLANGFFQFRESLDCQIEFLGPKTEELDWWQTGSFYQIYPRSFKDSNGDGIGDLNGVTEKLPYLKEIGITATWLSPIFRSPMADFGYDVSDFYSIQPEYGTMADFDQLIKRANELDIKIILDFVPNHSSDENEWFVKSAKREPGYEDFYVWHPGFPDPDNKTNRLPPNNWVSIFLGSAWQWNEVRQEFYLHQFLPKQPDLNYRNPKVVEAMKDVLKFWLGRGVSGFRVDAVPHLFEIKPDENGDYKDEPLSGNTNDPNDYGYLIHLYTKDQEETIDMIYQWRAVMDEYKKEHGEPSRILMTESYSDLDIIMRYYGNATNEGCQIPFNFEFITRLHKDSSADDFKNTIDLWMNLMPRGRTANWVMGNHDQSRVAARFGAERVDAMNMILLSLPGASITYNGEEIGMNDVWISWNDTVDPSACKTNSSVYERYSRDPERTPFQWDASVSAGFSTNPKTWLPIGPDYKEVNVAVQRPINKTHFNVYKEMQALRKSVVMTQGSLITKVYKGKILVIIRSMDYQYPVVVATSFSYDKEVINLSEFSFLSDRLEYLIVDSLSTRIPGDVVNRAVIEINPNESFVLKSKRQKGVSGNYFDYTLI